MEFFAILFTGCHEPLGSRAAAEDVEIFERVSLVNVLRYQQTVSDPASLIEPVTLSWDWIDIGEDRIEPLHCE